MKDNLKEWDLYEAGKRFNNRLDPPVADMVEVNWDMFNGLQWVNSGAFDDLPKPVFNVINRIISFFVASLTSNAVKVSFDTMVKLPFGDNENVEADIDVLNAAWENFAEREKLQDKVRQLYLNAAIEGDMCLHFYFDTDKKPYDGKLSDVIGEICCEVIRSTDIYVGNPNTRYIQSQPHVIIRGRATKEELQAEYDAIKGNDAYEIQSDGEDVNDDVIELDEVDSLGKATYIIFYKKKKVKRKYTEINSLGEEEEVTKEETVVLASKLVKDKYIYQDVETGMSLYPVAFNNWENQNGIYHGRALCTSIIPNQIFINRMFAMAMQNLMMTAFPKLIYDKNRVGNPSNRIGTSIGVDNIQPGDNIANLMKYLEPGNMSAQVVQLIDMAMEFTKDMLGANSALLGSVNPEAASGTAITIAARQSGVPLENPKNNQYELLDDAGRIFLDMVTTFYGERPVVIEVEGVKTIVQYDFEKLNDIYLSCKVDVGATTYWNEIAAIQTLDNHLNAGRISFEQYLKRVPDDYIPDRAGLLEDEKAKMQQAPQDDMSAIVSQMSPEMQAQFQTLPPEEQQALLQEFMGQQGQPQETVQEQPDIIAELEQMKQMLMTLAEQIDMSNQLKGVGL